METKLELKLHTWSWDSAQEPKGRQIVHALLQPPTFSQPLESLVKYVTSKYMCNQSRWRLDTSVERSTERKHGGAQNDLTRCMSQKSLATVYCISWCLPMKKGKSTKKSQVDEIHSRMKMENGLQIFFGLQKKLGCILLSECECWKWSIIRILQHRVTYFSI